MLLGEQLDSKPSAWGSNPHPGATSSAQPRSVALSITATRCVVRDISESEADGKPAHCYSAKRSRATGFDSQALRQARKQEGSGVRRIRLAVPACRAECSIGASRFESGDTHQTRKAHRLMRWRQRLRWPVFGPDASA